MLRKKSTPTILDVAAAAGVSVTTVSRVLNNKDDVAPETATRVRAVIDELGYESSLAARSMRSRRSQVIGLIVPDMDHAYVVEIIRGISRAIAGTKYELIAMTTGSQSHEERGRWEQQQVSRLNGTITDGVIVVAPDAQEFRTDYPLVAVDPYRETDAYPSVIAANHVGALAAVNYLLALGHRRIGFVLGNEHLQSAVRRRLGYEAALTAAGLPIEPALMVAGDFMRAGGRVAAIHLLGLADPPTAIFAANDDSAFGVIEAARDAGLRVPQDLSVVGFDNVPEAAMCQPPLTTVDQSIELISQLAVQMVIDLIDARSLAVTVARVPTHLIERASCAAPRGNTSNHFNADAAPSFVGAAI